MARRSLRELPIQMSGFSSLVIDDQYMPILAYISSGNVDQLAGNFALRIRNRVRLIIMILALLLAFAITPGLAFRTHPPDVRFRLDGDGADEGDERFEGHVSLCGSGDYFDDLLFA
jgi:hypothetical protein